MTAATKMIVGYAYKLGEVLPYVWPAGVLLWLAKINDIYSDLLQTDPLLLVALVTFWIADFVIGMGAATLRRDFKVERALAGLGKLFVYASTVLVFVMLSNAGNNYEWLQPVMGWWDETIMAALCYIEVQSIVRTLHGGAGPARKFLLQIKEIRNVFTSDSEAQLEVLVEEQKDEDNA